MTNYGLIVGRADSITSAANADGNGVDIDCIDAVHNRGIIQGAGAKGVGSDGLPNTCQGIALGGGPVENHLGAKVISVGDGILVDNSSAGPAFGATSITNEGLIQGDAGYGIKLVGSQADSLSNSGTIAGGNGMAVDMGGGKETVTLTGGTITGLLDRGDGTDRLDLSAETRGIAIDLGAGTVTGTTCLGSIAHFEGLVTGSCSDTLTGSGSGSSLLQGGEGDDVYHLAGSGDVVVEGADGGHDNVISAVNHTLGADLEALVLTDAAFFGAGNAEANAITGNDLGDQLFGFDGNDSLRSGAGVDLLDGGTGADTYVVDQVGDVVVELPGGGIDTVHASISYILRVDLENLMGGIPRLASGFR